MWNLRTKSASGEEVFNPLTQKNLTPRGGRKKGQKAPRLPEVDRKTAEGSETTRWVTERGSTSSEITEEV